MLMEWRDGSEKKKKKSFRKQEKVYKVCTLDEHMGKRSVIAHRKCGSVLHRALNEQ